MMMHSLKSRLDALEALHVARRPDALPPWSCDHIPPHGEHKHYGPGACPCVWSDEPRIIPNDRAKHGVSRVGMQDY